MTGDVALGRQRSAIHRTFALALDPGTTGIKAGPLDEGGWLASVVSAPALLSPGRIYP